MSKPDYQYVYQRKFSCRYGRGNGIVSGNSQPVIGLYYLSTNFVQASGCAVPATVMSVLRQGILLIPSLYLFHGLIGFSGIAVAHTAADILSVAVSILLLFRQYRMLVKKVEEQSGD